MKLLKIPLKLLALPVIFGLMAFHLVSSLLIGLSSIVTSLLSSVFLLGAVAGWINHASPSLIWQAVGIGLFLMFAPSIAEWLLGRITDLTIALMTFVAS